MMKFVVTFIFAGVLLSPPEAQGYQRMALNKSARGYTFQNAGDYGFLTSIDGKQFTVTDIWRNTPGQKWIHSKAVVYTSYMLKPMSDGLYSKVALSVVADHGMTMVKKEPYVLGMASSLYWNVIPGSEPGLYLVQNTQNDMCLESRGAGQVVGVSPCVNSRNQLWAVRAF